MILNKSQFQRGLKLKTQNIYQQKFRWKIILAIFAFLIVISSFWYTNRLVLKIASEERNKVKLWSEAIQNKAKLVGYTNTLFTELAEEEKKKVELWAEATKQLAGSNNLADFGFLLKVVGNNTTVPALITDESGKIITCRNLLPDREINLRDENDLAFAKKQLHLMKSRNKPIELILTGGVKQYLYYMDSRIFSGLKNVMTDIIQSFISEIVINSASVPVIFTDQTKQNVIAYGNVDSLILNDAQKLTREIAVMSAQNQPIEIELEEGVFSYIFYKDSYLLTQLRYYPLFQFSIIALFLLVAYYLFSTARKAEQNQVWVGMAKETAHQLGTPISSIVAWIEHLKLEVINNEKANGVILEVESDIKRLELIADRFSKIGTQPVLSEQNIVAVIKTVVDYTGKRASDKVKFNFSTSSEVINAKINTVLLSWVIENLLKNALDAIEGKGEINVLVNQEANVITIDVSDTGKGIPKSKFKTVFNPGYSTKKRGWGLGLALCKRIIEVYHSGKIFVKESISAKQTTFRLILPVK